MMKLALALSVLCLLGSIAFWVDCTRGAVSLPESADREASPPVRVEAPRRTFGPAVRLAAAREQSASPEGELFFEEEQSEELAEDELEPPAPEEAVLRGRVAVALGELPEGTRVFLSGVATPLPPEPGEVDQEAEEEEPEELAAGDSEPEEESEAGLFEEPEEITDVREVYDDGAFEFFVVPGQYQLVARAPGHLPAVLENIQVGAGDDLRGLYLDLSTGLSISGSVRSEGEPQDGIPVVAEGNGFRVTAYSDELGEFQIAGLVPGAYQVRAFAELAGGDQREVVAGGRVALDLARRGRLRGRVVDERGAALAHAVVYGVPYAAHEDEVDQDPYGPVDGEGYGLLGISSCGPGPSCRQVAETDAAGYFDIEVAHGSMMALGAEAGEARGAIEEVRSDARDVLLTVRRVKPVRLQLLDGEGRPTAGTAFVSSGNDRLDFASGALTAGADGQALYKPWPDVRTVIRSNRGLQVRVLDPLPPSVTIEKRRTPHRVPTYQDAIIY